MAEKLCLNWNNFQENVNAAFGNLREDREFSDVTLACEDGQQVEAHKVILAASSPFFKNILRRNAHPHPLIYMRGMKSENLLAIIDFLYCGVTNVYQENLESFLFIAEELQLKGLMGHDTKERGEDNFVEKEKQTIQKNAGNHFAHKPVQSNVNIENPGLKQQRPKTNLKKDAGDERNVALLNFESGDIQQLDEKVKSIMEKSLNKIGSGSNMNKRAYICKICRKEGLWVAIRDHIEVNHLEGISLPCNQCGNVFRSRSQLRKHRCVNNM